VDTVYNKGNITIIILDNGTTAMTGHQEHPGTGVTAQGKEAGRVVLEDLVRGVGVKNVRVVNAFDLKEVRPAVKSALDSDELSVIIVRGACAVKLSRRTEPRAIDIEECNTCGACFLLGCPSIQMAGDKVIIDSSLCVGDSCSLCQQICPRQAIKPKSQVKANQ
jgi:indolepyruvate ferredoxin oxidoreductase alpha subunit